MPRTSEDAYTELIRRVKEHALLGSVGGVLGWDERTYMPRKGAGLRAEQMALLARMTHELLTAPQVGALLAEVEASDLVRDPESAAAVNVHESQSRLWENQVGRGRPFWEHFFPRARQTFPEALADVALDDWTFAINDVQPSFIRVEADEATYNLHILLRFELDPALVSGDLAPADVLAAWTEKFRASFGLTPPTDREGCLQDIHWSGGGVGYFPTYTLGNLYAAQLLEGARQDLPGLEDDFRRGAFGRLKGWLNEKVHRPGQRWRAAELCRRVTGKPLTHEPLLAYLRGKYAPLYRI